MLLCSLVGVLPMLAQPIASKTDEVIPANDPRIGVMGRIDTRVAGRVRFGYPGVTLRVHFTGTSLTMRTDATTPNSYFDIFVDGEEHRVLRLAQGESEVTIADGLGAGDHTVELVRRTETWVGIVTVTGFRLSPGGALLAAQPWPERKMLFIGDSVTCGEAMERPPDWKSNRPASWNPYESYGMLLARKFDAQVQLVCFGGRGLVRDWQGKHDVLNAPQFFDLALPEDKDAPRWDQKKYVPDVVVVSLGTNDFNLAIGDFPDKKEWIAAYVRFVKAIRANFPAAYIFLTEGAIVDDKDDAARPRKTVLKSYISETASRLGDPRVHVLESIHYPGDPSDAHPTTPQHAAMARDMEPVIRQVVGW